MAAVFCIAFSVPKRLFELSKTTLGNNFNFVTILLLRGHTIPYLVRNVCYLVRHMWLPSRCTSHSPSNLLFTTIVLDDPNLQPTSVILDCPNDTRPKGRDIKDFVEIVILK